MRKLLLLLSFGLFFVPAFAQFSSSVSGTVTDPSGSVVSGAKVTLTNTNTNASQMFVSNASGQYFFNRLSPGSYTVTGVATGFEKTSQAITITTDEKLGVDLMLSVGSVADTVTVTADEGHGINPDETRVEYTLSAREIEEFPLQNQATLGLIKTAPGATGISEGHLNVNINQTQASEAANGRSSNANIFVLDSIPINSELQPVGGNGGAVDFVPHPDMIEEISLQTTTFTAENGASTGITTSITSKSGGNKFHGDMDYSYSGNPLQATPFFLHSQVPVDPAYPNGPQKWVAQAPNTRNQNVSGALGGPIWKDRTFFFGSYFNQQNDGQGGGQQTIVDPRFTAWALSNPAFQNSLGVSRELASTIATRAVNIVPFEHVSDAGLSEVNCPSDPACSIPMLSTANYTTPQSNGGAQYNFRLDHSARGGNDRFYMSFFRYDQHSTSNQVTPTFDAVTPSTGHYLSGNYTHTFSPQLLNEASFGLTRFEFDYKPSATAASQSQVELPYVAGPFEFNGGIRAAFLESELEHQLYGRDTVSWVHGRHNFSFGFQGTYQNELRDNSLVYSRPFYLSNFSIEDFLHDQTDYELIYTLSANLQNNPGKFIPQRFGAGVIRFGAFAQDSWKVTSNLLLTLGIRWDDFGNPSPDGKDAQQYANVNFPSGPLPTEVANLNTAVVKSVFSSSRNKNFLPRGSFAYTIPGGGRKTVVHGGVGFYQDDINLEEVTSALPTQSPVRLSLTLGSWTPIKPLTSYGNSLVQGPAGGNPYGFNFPTINLGPYTKHGAATSTSGLSLQADEYGMDPNLKPQSAYIYNLGAERELPRNMVVGLLYAGSHGTNQLVESNLNTYAGEQLPTSTGPMNADFGKIKFIRNAGTSDYNALIATLRQTVGKLTYQASYTLGLSKSDPTANDTVSDQYDIHSQYAYTDSDVRQRFTFTQVYEVPTRFKSQLMKTALGGWAMNNTLIMQSGTPFSAQTPENVTSGFDFNNDGEGGDIPVYLGTKKNFSRSEARISAMSRGTQSMFPGAGNLIPTAGTCPVSQCSFAQPAANTEGGLRNEFRGPGYFSLDSGIGKKFELPWFSDQKASLAIRLQGSNVLNVTNFGNPGATFDQTAQFGVVSGTAQNRVFQFGGRLQF